MNQTSKKQGISLKPGSIVDGKWHHNRYYIIKQLGRGAIGSVYLCESNGKKAALKISDKGSSVTMEVNVLKTFQKVQGKPLGPSLLDVDDWIDSLGNRYSFYIMEYLKGKEVSTFIKQHGEEWLGILVIQLLEDLGRLHREGWVFGDLKTDNLIVTYPPARLKWIDVGGTTQIGRSIKEYTEFFDRGYWGMGSRRAEPSYDLFALAMVMIHYYHPIQFTRGKVPKKTLMTKLQATPQLKKYHQCIRNALLGQYNSSEQMRDDLSAMMMKQNDQVRSHQSNTSKIKNPQIKRKDHQSQNKKKEIVHPVFESLGICAVVILFYVFYLILI
ncbi:protein kinase family protein [Aquibacillus halophilus]|uniref:Protein kinase family protein n=1 Tax=Aquibacillus halophilus TaxID=930132 RepID=A0A6A8DH04_9BACI|nr:serine/threonine-protein kinase [Aquibacillus halophilus]MRH44968.1 protein kinase family protein [Aquibacillus halophilus]